MAQHRGNNGSEVFTHLSLSKGNRLSQRFAIKSIVVATPSLIWRGRSFTRFGKEARTIASATEAQSRFRALLESGAEVADLRAFLSVNHSLILKLGGYAAILKFQVLQL